MIARIVPAVRLRRDTTSWSYKVPTPLTVRPGQLVRIRFRGVVVVGAVWEVMESDPKATQMIESIVSEEILIRPPARLMIETMSDRGLCSLSTSLFIWLPEQLRQMRQNTFVPEPQGAQHGVCIAGQRPQQEKMLRGPVAHLFSDTTGNNQFLSWRHVNSGTAITGIGREGALFAPWRDLQSFTLIEPEDISFYRESIPYLPLTDLLVALADGYKIKPTLRSFLPSQVAQMLWGSTATGNDRLPPTISHIDQTGQPLLPPALVERLKRALSENQPVVILLNAHDRFIDAENGHKKKKVGVESLPHEIANALNLDELPPSIQIGTRALFHNPLPPKSLGIIFSMQQWLTDLSIGDRLHGWSDIGRLLGHSDELILLSRSPADPLIQSLISGKWSEYLVGRLERLRTVGLPPFCEQIALSIKSKETSQAAETYTLIEPQLRHPWLITQPFVGQWRKTSYVHILLTAPTGTRLPTAARETIIALERPWKVQRSPWHIL